MTINPFVTIILPVRNEAGHIAASLQAVMAQDYPAEQLEVIVADGMSSDGTRAAVQEIARRHPRLSIRLVDNRGRIVPTGMNAALRAARGEIIVRVDGHCVIAPDYVSSCVRHLGEDGAAGVGGPMETIGETPLAGTIAVAMSSPFGVGDSSFRTLSGKTCLVDTVPFPAYTRAVIQQAGLYDEELVRNQDDEYNYRIRGLGGKILLAADVRSRYYSRGTLVKLWKQYYQYGFYKVRVLQKHPLQMRPRQFVPPAFALALTGSALAALLLPWGWLALAAVGGSYLLANLGASLLTAARRGWVHLALLPVCFAVLHLSYGLGFLAGLVRFWNRWTDRRGKVPALTPSPR